MVIAPNGDIFVAEGHGARQQPHPEVRQGRQVHQEHRASWAPAPASSISRTRSRSTRRAGSSSAIASNNRIQIFDQDGTFISEYKRVRPPERHLHRQNDILYVADSESGSVSRNHYGWQRGIRIGQRSSDGKVIGFIPDPETRTNRTRRTSAARARPRASRSTRTGNIYGAEVGPKAVNKYVKK